MTLENILTWVGGIVGGIVAVATAFFKYKSKFSHEPADIKQSLKEEITNIQALQAINGALLIVKEKLEFLERYDAKLADMDKELNSIHESVNWIKTKVEMITPIKDAMDRVERYGHRKAQE